MSIQPLRPWRRCLAALLLGPAIAAAAASDSLPGRGIELGVAPFLPARTLVQNYQPLRRYLEQQLHEPVTIVTAPDYQSYYQRIQRREYPVIVAVANVAYLAAAECGYRPMLRPLVDTRPVLVVARRSTLTRALELRGKTVALPEPLAIVAMQARPMLSEAGLDPDRDVQLKHFSTHSAAVYHVLAGEVAAAIVSDRALAQMTASAREGVRIVQTWERGAAPGVVYLASPTLPRQRVAQLTEAILRFTRDQPEGRELMKSWGYGGFVPATSRDLEPLAPYGALLKAALSKKVEATKK
jgi:phosphonate transport system substrate-binding protein